MATTCSVILILESFDVYFGKERVFLDRGLSVLVDSSYRDFFLTYPERVIVADFGAEFISRYLKANNLRDISDCREYPSYLKINFADFSLIKGLISWANHCAEGNDSNLLIVFYVQIMPDDFVMQLHRF